MFPDHFSAVAAAYQAYRPHYPPELADVLGGGETAWDVGCGNGQLSTLLAARFARVIATDASRAQIDAAVPHPRVEYRCAPAEDAGLSDASVDLIVAAQAAHWFRWERFVAEAGRVARPGARLALVSYARLVVEGDAGAVVDAYYDHVAGPYWPPERAHVENGYRDLRWPYPAVPAPALAMTARWTCDELLGYVTTWSATQQLVKARGAAPFDELAARLRAVWPENEPRAIRWPLTIVLARR